MNPTISTETQDIHKLIEKARWSQFGPDWSLTNPDRKVYVQRIQALADILGEVTNVLEAIITPGTPNVPPKGKGKRS